MYARTGTLKFYSSSKAKHLRGLRVSIHNLVTMLTDYKCCCRSYRTLFGAGGVVASSTTPQPPRPPPPPTNILEIVKHNCQILCVLDAYVAYALSRISFLNKDELKAVNACIMSIQRNAQRCVVVSHIDFEFDESLRCAASNSRISLPVIRVLNNDHAVCQAAAVMCCQEFVKFVQSHENSSGFINVKPKILQQLKQAESEIAKLTAFG